MLDFVCCIDLLVDLFDKFVSGLMFNEMLGKELFDSTRSLLDGNVQHSNNLICLICTIHVEFVRLLMFDSILDNKMFDNYHCSLEFVALYSFELLA